MKFTEHKMNHFMCVFFFKFIYFERLSEQRRGQREMERENVKQLRAVITEPGVGLNTMNCEIMT